MKHLLSATALVATLAFTPAIASANNFDPHQRCKADEDKRQILGGLAGAVLGGVIGSQVAGSGARTEGSFIAGTIGALAGAGIADKTIDCDPSYPDQRSYSGGTYTSSPVYSGSGTTYSGSSTYSSPQTYQDRVTVSNHPVYSNPTYGAQTYSQGTSYNSGTSYSAPVTSTARTTYASAPTTRYHSAPSTTYVSQPAITSYTPSYTRPAYNPQYRTVRTSGYYADQRIGRRGQHYHGRYSCDMRH